MTEDKMLTAFIHARSRKLRTREAFTLVELVVAVGVLAVILSVAGMIFRVTTNAHRLAIANAEIMQKLRAITDQLNADFKGLRKDGEIFVTWSGSPRRGVRPGAAGVYERFDQIMFFTDGDFQSYRTYPMVRGNVARVSYMLAKKGSVKAQNQAREKRNLARTQHILVSDPTLPDFFDPNTFDGSDAQWYDWRNRLEYDRISLEGWKNISTSGDPNKWDMLSVITGVGINPSTIPADWLCRGATVDTADPNSIHMLLCEGVGEFTIQGWSDVEWRWVPQIDPDGDGDLADDSDFPLNSDGTALHPQDIPGVLYPAPYGAVELAGIFARGELREFPPQWLDEAHFDLIPGLGRALKFTFTLYDSKGVITDGRTFTHIVYLGD
ncbi:MAG: prepilin-type N-terminal cleavage/methylation domain-containing protein [Phycisphaerales bacterium]|nr:MAG: prepilin-type N-terminal cleavage/methylation domain-containing protein [Phycisphaerales bacterium]